MNYKAAAERALSTVEDPCSAQLKAGWSITDLGLLTDVYEKAGELVVEVVLTDPLCPFFDHLEELIAGAVAAETGHPNVVVDVSGDVAWDPTRLRNGARMLPIISTR